MFGKPKTIYALVLLWVALAGILLLWGIYSFVTLVDIPTWSSEPPSDFKDAFDSILPILHFGYLLSTIIFTVFSFVFIILAYGTLKKDHWVWTTGLILSTIFLVIFGLMLAGFIINVLVFKDDFSIIGLVSVIVTFITNLGVTFYLTRPATKIYFETEK
jgi:hypothetical protein